MCIRDSSKGALAVIIEDKNFENTEENIFCVESTLEFLQNLAKHHRAQLTIPIIALTAVSYTHLDVYKRQSLSLSSPFGTVLTDMIFATLEATPYCISFPLGRPAIIPAT